MTTTIAVLRDGEATAPELDTFLGEVFEGQCIDLGLSDIDEAAARRERLQALLPSRGTDPVDEVLASKGGREQAIDAAAMAMDTDLLVVDGGAAEISGIGKRCERLLRRRHKDTLVVKDGAGLLQQEGNILVCIDGSPQSYSGLLQGLELSRRTGRKAEALAVYDPYIHYTLFNGIVKVLSEQAATVFKFKDQEKLHEEIIDTGLAKIYQAHLEVARRIGEEEDVPLKITLLDGKAYEKIIRYANKTKPWLIIMGRIGVHSDEGMDIGSTAENVLRACDANMLVLSSTFVPKIDVQAEQSIEWTPDAKVKMERVPSFVKGVATTAILRWAMERGHSVITPSVINEAMGDLLPAGAAQAMGYVAEEVAKAKDNLHQGKTYICGDCGYAARDFQPVVCPVCSAEGASFDLIDREVLESIGTLNRGDLEEEETFDGKVLRWTSEAKAIVRRVPAGYERRRSKARIEKTARVRGIETITEEFAMDIVQQDVAENSYLSTKGERLEVDIKQDEKGDDTIAKPREDSEFTWTDAAWTRMCRVPEGFMRNMTRERVEGVAAERGFTSIDLQLCEDGIAVGRQMMAEMLTNYSTSGGEENSPAS